MMPEQVMAGLRHYDSESGTEDEDALDWLERQGLRGTMTTTRRTSDVIRLLERGMPAMPTIASFADEYPHILVIRGIDGDEFLINDPYIPGFSRVRISQLEDRWRRYEHRLLYLPI